MYSSNYCFLTCTQISQEAGQLVWYSHLLKNFPEFVVVHTVKGFGIVSKTEIDVLLELSCFFDDPADIGNLISGSSAFSKTTWTSGSSRFMYCWSLAWRILSSTLLACEMSALCSSLSILWHCLFLGLEWKLTFSSPVATAEFSKFVGILSAAFSQHRLLVVIFKHKKRLRRSTSREDNSWKGCGKSCLHRFQLERRGSRTEC